MSRSVDLFVASDLPIEEVAGQLGRAIGASFTPSPNGASYVLRDGKVVIEFGPHPYRDDGDLLLSRYAYALSACVPDDARPQDTPEAVVLRKIAQAVREKGLFRVLLVMDLQFRDGDERDGAPAAR
jgi:hypothetical protein